MGYYEKYKKELEDLLSLIFNEKKKFETYLKFKISELKSQEEKNNILRKDIDKLAKERQIGFPWLAEAYDEIFKIRDEKIADDLINRRHPARSAKEEVKEQTKLRRNAEKECKIAQNIIKFYETMVPSLVDLKEEIDLDNEEENKNLLRDYTEEELEDKVTTYLSKEEYRRLSEVEKNQIALDRYKKRPQSKSQIGKNYERYIGYLYEKKGYKVEYQGIEKGLEDLGRDLICKKDDKIILIQCKNRAGWKTIFEKHIFQFFGTLFEYKYNNPGKDVKGVFVTSTGISPLAKKFADEFKNELNLELRENKKFDKNYPCIKCNISNRNREKIYHLPFDQQYDNVIIEPEKGEFYCSTTHEAEEKGFRRAFRHII